VHDDAVHLIVGFAHEPQKGGSVLKVDVEIHPLRCRRSFPVYGEAENRARRVSPKEQRKG
jgi:hypothetical protein